MVVAWASASHCRIRSRSSAPLNATLASLVATGAASAIRTAVSTAVATRSAAGTTALTRPIAAASRASTIRPVKISSLARTAPTTSGSNRVAAIPGCMPRRVKGAQKVASTEAKRRSQASARHNPAPTVAPFTAAIVGTSTALIFNQVR